MAGIDPDTLSGLVARFAADTITGLSDGAAVASWAPAAGAETAPAAQATAGQRPTYKTNIVGGKPVVRFTTAGSSNLDTGAWGTSRATPNMAVVVAKMTTGGIGSAGNFFTGRSGVLNYMGQENGSINIGAGAGNQLTLAHTPDTAFHLFAAAYNGASSAIYLDSATAGATGSTGVGTSADNMPGMRIGSTSAGTSNFPDADIAEIIFYDRVLTSAELTGVMQWLDAKYDLGLGLGHREWLPDGTDGTNISAGNAGFDGFFLGAGNTAAYEDAITYPGRTMSALLETEAGVPQAALIWSDSWGDWDEAHASIYLYLDAYPAAYSRWWNFALNDAAGDLVAGFDMRTDGKIVQKYGDGPPSEGDTSANALPLNQWVRIEIDLVCSTGTGGSFDVRIYHTPSSATPTETLSAAGVSTGNATVDMIRTPLDDGGQGPLRIAGYVVDSAVQPGAFFGITHAIGQAVETSSAQPVKGLATANLCANPHADVDLSGWTTAGAIHRATSVTGFPKATAVECDNVTGVVLTARGAVTAGSTYTLSAKVKNLTSLGDQKLYIEWRDASDAAIDYTAGPAIPLPSNIATPVAVTGTAPAGAAFAALLLAEAFGARQFAAVMIEPGPTAHDYADGDTDGWHWNGTPGLSSSAQGPPTTLTVELGQAVDVEAARPITSAKLVPVATAVETSTGRALTRAKTRPVAAAVELSAAAAVTARHVLRVDVGQAVEDALAGAWTRAKRWTLGRAVELDRAADFRSAGEPIPPTVLVARNAPTATLTAGHGGARLEARHG